jgi:hypothetical protein
MKVKKKILERKVLDVFIKMEIFDCFVVQEDDGINADLEHFRVVNVYSNRVDKKWKPTRKLRLRQSAL